MKPKYFKLSFDDSNEDSLFCSKYNLGKINKYILNKSLKIEDWDDVTFYYDQGEPEDLLGNSLGWVIVSERVQKAFTDLEISNIQFLPINVIQENSDASLKGYAVINILSCLSALDRENSEYEEDPDLPDNPIIFNVVLKRSSIKEIDIFRLKEQKTLIFVSEKIRTGLIAMGATGFYFPPTSVV